MFKIFGVNFLKTRNFGMACLYRRPIKLYSSSMISCETLIENGQNFVTRGKLGPWIDSQVENSTFFYYFFLREALGKGVFRN